MPPRRRQPARNNRGQGAGAGGAVPNIGQLVNEQLLAALPAIVTQVATGLQAAQGAGPAAGNPPRCSYKAFMSCKPKQFHGTEGAVGLLKWIEGIETVLHISKCEEADHVEFASCQLMDRAQTWWKNQIQVRGREAANALSWAEFTKLLTEEYCTKSDRQKLEAEFWNHEMVGNEIEKYTVRFHELARMVPHMVTPEEKRIDRYIWGLSPAIRGMVTSANPTTIQTAVTLANQLTSDLVRSGGFQKANSDQKRKAETSSGQISGGNDDKRQKRIRNCMAAIQEPTSGKRYDGTCPKCAKCNFHHFGDCPTCNNCNRVGHYAKYCRQGKKDCFECGSNAHTYKDCPRLKGEKGTKPRACYECGSPDHMRNNCPVIKGKGGIQVGPARGRAFVIKAEDAPYNDNVVTGTFLLNNFYNLALFDLRYRRKFILSAVRLQLKLPTNKLGDISGKKSHPYHAGQTGIEHSTNMSSSRNRYPIK